MKKLAAFLSVIISLFSIHSQDVPVLLKGVWKNAGRYVEFDSGVSTAEGAVPRIVLREFYQRYDDRAAESPSFSESSPRPVNDSTQMTGPEEMHIKFIPLTFTALPEGSGSPEIQSDGDMVFADGMPSGAWNMQVTYPGRREIFNVPVAVIGKGIYLKFTIKQEDSDSISPSPVLAGTVMNSGHPLDGFWQDSGNASGITISPPVSSRELLSFFVDGESFYYIRYWRTDMEYDGQKNAVFSDSGRDYSVKKHLRVAGETFTCVNGRGTRIRNIQKSSSMPGDFSLNSIIVRKNRTDDDGRNYSYDVRSSTICVFGKPFLELVEKDGQNMSLEQILEEDAKRQFPSPKPLFPPHGVLDFDFGIVEDPPADYNRRMLDLGK